MNIRRVPFDHPDAVKLNDEVQAEYDVRYGDGGDATLLDPADFAPPNGQYLVARTTRTTSRSPRAAGAARTPTARAISTGDAELKRMFVVEQVRGRGLARRILAALEEDARAAGRTRMVLETGTKQPEAGGPVHLQRLRAVRGVRLLPLPRGKPLLREGAREPRKTLGPPPSGRAARGCIPAARSSRTGLVRSRSRSGTTRSRPIVMIGRDGWVDAWTVRGFEPLAPSMRTRCATGLRHRPLQR